MLDEISNKIIKSGVITFYSMEAHSIEDAVYNYITTREIQIIQANSWNLIQVSGVELFLHVTELL